MKTTLFIIFIFFATTCLSQNFYAQEKTIEINGSTYMCKHRQLPSFYFIHLYKNNPRFVGKEWLNKDGSVPHDDILDGNIKVIEDDDWTAKASYNIVEKHLKNSGIPLCKDHGVDITMYVDPDNGKVVEVEYVFASDRDYTKVPPQVYYEIEKELKEKIFFIPTVEGRKLNYLMVGWMHKTE